MPSRHMLQNEQVRKTCPAKQNPEWDILPQTVRDGFGLILPYKEEYRLRKY